MLFIFNRFRIFPVAVLLLMSCHSIEKEKAVPEAKPYHIDLPAGNLSTEEKNSLSKKCSEWFDSVLAPANFNGGILVAKNGVPVYERYVGNVVPKGSEPFTAETPVHIASVSKTFTAMAVLKLMEQGKLDLDDSVSRFLPEFNYPGVTVKTLLNHRSGIPNYAYFMEDLGWDKSEFISNHNILRALITQKDKIKNIGRPDASFSYCNTNFALLALIIEKASGMGYADYLQKEFFDPLNMKHTFVFTLKDTARATSSYDWRGDLIKLDFLDQVYGDKNIYSTVRDLLIWDRALASGKLFKSETMKLAFTPYSNERPGIKNYGLGWRMNVYPTGKKMIFHNGWWHGNNASFIRLPEQDATIIVLGNRFTRQIYKAHHLADIFDNYNAEPEESDSANPAENHESQLGSK
ncbi:MAG: class A beta-lactamase-related serine hydrolase [Chitinophagaceae bacterium]|nr:MAG: class A beta-lactamase-related serine hydrolase [Chitinophagaceae bacterium]